MDLLKALKRTTILSTAVGLLALGATPARALEGTAFLAHISASITSTLNITEVQAMKFGNFAVTAAAATLQLDPDGKLTSSGAGIVPLYGNGSTQGLDGTHNAQETASQSPGFFTVAADVPGDVYITFADLNGNIIDSNHPSNNATLDGGAGHLWVDSFTFAEDDHTTGYVGTASSADAPYGQKVAVGASDVIRVGATLHKDATAPAAGRYTGTYYIMISY